MQPEQQPLNVPFHCHSESSNIWPHQSCLRTANKQTLRTMTKHLNSRSQVSLGVMTVGHHPSLAGDKRDRQDPWAFVTVLSLHLKISCGAGLETSFGWTCHRSKLPLKHSEQTHASPWRWPLAIEMRPLTGHGLILSVSK